MIQTSIGALPQLRDPHGAPRPTVLHVRVVTGAGGGPEKTILNSPRFLDRLGFDCHCVYMHPPEDPGFNQLRARAGSLNASLISIPDRGAWDARVVTRLARICREAGATIWHGHDYKSNALGLLLRRVWPMHLATTVHGWVQKTSRLGWYYGIDRFCLRRYERVVCVSPDLHAQCLEAGVAPERCVLIENAIDLTGSEPAMSREEAKYRLGIPADRFLIGAVGRLSAEKGFDILIRTVDRLLESGRDVALAIAGEGAERPRLESLIAARNLQNRVRLLGYLPDPRSLYEALDVFALSSLREGLPNVVLEAMAGRIPIVATNIAGIPRIIQHEQNGLVVEPGCEYELAGALERMFADESLRVKLGNAGRQTVEARYTFDRRMRRMADLYRNLLQETGDSRIGRLDMSPADDIEMALAPDSSMSVDSCGGAVTRQIAHDFKVH